jgi:Spy/CpxP family protein refolding chaperone
MRPWIQRSLIALFGAGVLVGGLSACGHREHGAGMAQVSAEDAAKWREKLIERAGKELQLDAAQKQQLGMLFDKMREQRNALVGGAANPRDEVRALIAGDKFDRGRANALVDEKTGALRSKSPEVIAAAGDFYDGLRPEQQAKLREWLQNRGRGPFSSWRS